MSKYCGMLHLTRKDGAEKVLLPCGRGWRSAGDTLHFGGFLGAASSDFASRSTTF